LPFRLIGRLIAVSPDWAVDCRSSQSPNQVFNRYCFLFWMILAPGALGVSVVYANNLELQLVKREIKDGTYSAMAYLLVKATIEMPFLVLLVSSRHTRMQQAPWQQAVADGFAGCMG
jgi:hypothetical protein